MVMADCNEDDSPVQPLGGTVLKPERISITGTFSNHSLESVGRFGLTELGCGNNAVEMLDSYYDRETNEFVIHSLSQRHVFWITNGGGHAHFCVVFARLVADGNNEGIHGFLVRIRDDKMKMMPA